jgi:peptidoglycan hydrolase CwlO-like protein
MTTTTLSRSELISELIKNTKSFDNDDVFMKIFDTLSNNDTLSNYSHNSNGIFFDISKISIKTLRNINNDLIKYISTNIKAIEAKNILDEKMDSMKKEMANISINKKNKEFDESDKENDESDKENDESDKEIDESDKEIDESDKEIDEDYELFGSCSDSD